MAHPRTSIISFFSTAIPQRTPTHSIHRPKARTTLLLADPITPSQTKRHNSSSIPPIITARILLNLREKADSTPNPESSSQWFSMPLQFAPTDDQQPKGRDEEANPTSKEGGAGNEEVLEV